MGELHETVDRLLHDAEHKESAAHFAETLMREPQKAVEFRVERDALVAEANRLDPSHAAPARICPMSASPSAERGNVACCAHLRVVYRTEEVRVMVETTELSPGGWRMLTHGWWECSDCAKHFVPVAALESAASPPPAPRAAGAPQHEGAVCKHCGKIWGDHYDGPFCHRRHGTEQESPTFEDRFQLYAGPAPAPCDFYREVEKVSGLLVDFEPNTAHESISAHVAAILDRAREAAEILNFRASELRALRARCPEIVNELAQIEIAVRYCAGAAPPSGAGVSEEIQQLRGVCLALSEALAKRCLAEANATREAPNDWPSGQEWDELVGTSHSIMRHRAWTEAGLDINAMRALLFDKYGSPKEHDDDAARTAPAPREEI